MSNEIERLDLSKPPPGYEVFTDNSDDRCWHYSLACELALNDCPHGSREAAIVAAWAHYQANHDPPGMWTGFAGVSPDLETAYPRMGAGLAEFAIRTERQPVPMSEVGRVACSAAWQRYLDALCVADILDRENSPSETRLERCAWPRPLMWTDEQRAEVRRWSTGLTAELPEVLRG